MTLRIENMPSDEAIIGQAGEVIMRAFEKNYPGAWDTLEDGIEEVYEMLAEDRICRVAFLENQLVGWIGGIPQYDGNVWELHPLAVHPDFQGKGVGRALVEDFETLVAEKGALTIILGSDDENNMTTLSGVDLYDDLPGKIASIRNLKGHAYSFYEKMGFTIIGLVPDANGIGKPDIIMGKRVKSSP